MPISETYNMDCMEYMRSIPDKFFELAIVDPPYGLDAKSVRCGGGKYKNSCLARGDIRNGISVHKKNTLTNCSV